MSTKTILWVIVLFVSIIIGAIISSSSSSLVEKDVKAQYLKGGNFRLSNGGEVFELANIEGKRAILYFGFTSCPDVCPVGLSVIRDALNSDPSLQDVQALFVTLDPERDDVKKLQDYTAFFHPNISGLTGTLDEIKQVTSQYGTYFKKTDVNEVGDYSVDHTAYFYLIDRAGELIRVLDHNAKAEEISTILSKL